MSLVMLQLPFGPEGVWISSGSSRYYAHYLLTPEQPVADRDATFDRVGL